MSQRSIRMRLALTGLLFLALVSPAWGASVWREGESADEARMQRHSWYDSVKTSMLAGGGWLSNFGDLPGLATYRLQIPEAGRYTLWVRANPTKSRLSWKLDDGAWREAPMDRAQHRRNVAEGGAVDLRYIGWVRLGARELKPGRLTLRLKTHSGNNNHGAIDAIYLTTEGREPVGKGNPAEQAKQHAPGFFPWAPGGDPLREDSPIDLRRLNESTAGASGFVRREGDRFVLGNGEPVRFWMVQGGLGDDPQQFDRRARRLAKYGVNVVRMGGGAFFNDWRHDKEAFRDRLARFHRKVAALKKHGIYTYIDHLYWHTHHEITEEVYPGFGDGKQAIALMFFSEKFQNLYKDFIRELMTAADPHTDKSMAQDPAVAFLEIQNESSLLFWTFKPRDFPEPERRLVERKFADWLKDEYGSLAAVREAWGENPRAGNPTADRFEQGRAGLYGAGMLTGQQWAVNQRTPRRASDQLRFMVEAQKRFYEDMTQALHEDVGVKQVIAPSNWKTADARVLDGLERYTYTGAQVVCRNTYFGVEYKEGGQQRFYAIEEGDTYRDRSALRSPGRPSPLATPQIAGYPFMITENNWTRPNRYRAEWPMLVAAYGRMLGIDGWTFFAMGEADWRHRMGVWDLSNPSVLGQFPAAALMYRRGDVRQPEKPAVYERVSLEDAYRMKGTATVPLRGADALWEVRIDERERSAGDSGGQVDPLAHFVGPVVQEFVSGTSEVETAELGSHIARQRQIVRSMTGELRWDAANGVMTVDTPRAQGAWGFLKDAGRIKLSNVTIESSNTYGSIVAVSLDGKPLTESDRVLVQTGTWDRPYGFETEPTGDGYQRITDLGGYPLNVRRIRAEIELEDMFEEAVVLDGNGYPTDRRAEMRNTGNDGTRIKLPEDAIYTVLR